MRLFRLGAVGAGFLIGEKALAWDCVGHRAITLLALDHLPGGMPAFCRDDAGRAMIASQACEPDRWRIGKVPEFLHANNPDHYINLETVTKAGLSLQSLPKFRNEYTEALAKIRVNHPDLFEPLDEIKDPAHTRPYPGYLPYAIVERYGQLQASFKTLRIIDELNDPTRAAQRDQAVANIVWTMGVLSHYVGDAAQPLHTTIHHHGWVGENPKGFTTRYSFHAEIDGGVLEKFGVNYASLRGTAITPPSVNAADPAADVRTYLSRSFERVEPLYQLDLNGSLLGEEGKSFLIERLTDASGVLAALYTGAWAASEPTPDEIRRFVTFDHWNPAEFAPLTPAPSPAPDSSDSSKNP